MAKRYAMKQHMIKSTYSLVLLVLTSCALVLALNACTTTDADRDSELPWNTPQSWEGSPLIPGMDRQ